MILLLTLDLFSELKWIVYVRPKKKMDSVPPFNHILDVFSE